SLPVAALHPPGWDTRFRAARLESAGRALPPEHVQHGVLPRACACVERNGSPRPLALSAGGGYAPRTAGRSARALRNGQHGGACGPTGPGLLGDAVRRCRDCADGHTSIRVGTETTGFGHAVRGRVVVPRGCGGDGPSAPRGIALGTQRIEIRVRRIPGRGRMTRAFMRTLVLCAAFAFAVASWAEQPRIILDTDFRSDVDDVGSLALLNALADADECQL